MKRTLWVAVGIGVAAVLTLVVYSAFLAGRALREAEETASEIGEIKDEVLGTGEFTTVGEVRVQSIRALSELSTVEMVEYTTIEKGDDRGWLNWAAGDRIAMFAVARIQGGIDLAKLEDDAIFADRATGTVSVILPPAEITTILVDNEATAVYDRDTGLFTKGDPQLERAARLAAEEVLVEQALENDILGLAEERAIQVITDLLTGLGYTDITVTVAGS